MSNSDHIESEMGVGVYYWRGRNSGEGCSNWEGREELGSFKEVRRAEMRARAEIRCARMGRVDAYRRLIDACVRACVRSCAWAGSGFCV